MVIVPEQDITYINCNVPAQDYELWDSTKAYKLGDKVSVLEDRLNYYATKNIDVGVRPDPSDLKGINTSWFAETANRYKMLEKNVYNQTVNQDIISFSCRSTNIDTLSFFNVEAKEIYIKISDFTTGVTLYEHTKMLSDNDISLYHYFFVPAWLKDRLTLRLEGTQFENKISEIIDNLSLEEIVDRYTVQPPLFFNALVEIEIRRPGLEAKCGKVFVGQSLDLGFSIWSGTQIKTKRFGKVVQDDYFGNYEIERGNIVNQITVPVQVDTKKLDHAIAILKKYAYDFCLFSADIKQGITNLTAYGVAEDTSFSPAPYSTQYTLKIGSTI